MFHLKGSGTWFLFSWIVVFIVLLTAFNAWVNYNRNVNAPLMTDKTLILKPSRAHHYYVKGLINNVPVDFFVDTGASLVAIPEKLARQAKLPFLAETSVSTANGNAKAVLTRIPTLTLGGIHLNNIRGVIMTDSSSQEALLGMSALKYFNFEKKKGLLILSPIKS